MEWQQELQDRYPLTLKHISYFECNEGWRDLLDNLCFVIEAKIKSSKLEDMYAVQVKEKFGTLRFYMTLSNDFIDGAINMAERQSAHICEICGNQGKTENLKGMLKTLCKDHIKEFRR